MRQICVKIAAAIVLAIPLGANAGAKYSPSNADLATIRSGFTSGAETYFVSNVYGTVEMVDRDVMIWVCGDVQLLEPLRTEHFIGILVRAADGRSEFGPIEISGQYGATRASVKTDCDREMQWHR